LKIETELIEDHQSKITVEVDADQVESMKRRAARRIADKVKVPGFRPGKAPYQVIVRQVGEGTVFEKALELLVDDIYPSVIEESKIKPYGPGRLENILSTDPLKLEFVVPLDAEVDLGDYQSIRKPYKPKKITKKDIDTALMDLRERQAVIEPVDRPAEEGDLITVKLSATRKQIEEGKDPIIIRESSYPIVIHPAKTTTTKKTKSGDKNIEWPFPGFSQNLVGLLEGDEKTIQYSYPTDLDDETKRGVDAEFHLAVMNVKSRKLPELDEDFLSSLGEYENLDALLHDIRSSLEDQSKQVYNQNYDQEILQKAVNQASFKYPSQMLDQELEKVINDFDNQLQRQRLSMDLYLKTRNLDMDGLKEEMRPVAEERLKQNLFLFELSEAEDIKIDPDELQGEAQNTIDYLNKVLPEKEAKKLTNKNVYSNLVSNVYADLLSRRAIEHFRDICSRKLDQEQSSDIPSQSADDIVDAKTKKKVQETIEQEQVK